MDRASFEAELQEQVEFLRFLAFRLSGDPSEAEDLLQATLERVLTKWDKFEPGSNLRAWLARVMTNMFINFRRRRLRLSEVELDAEAVPAAPDADAPPKWAELTVDDVYSALAKISPRLRTVFRLFHLDGLSYQEIASQEQIKINTVGTRLRRARSAVKTQLEVLLQ